MTRLYGSAFDRTSIGRMIVEIRTLVAPLVAEPRRLMNMIRELADNTLFHSGKDGGRCRVHLLEDYLTVTIRDEGRGIHGSLADLYADLDERAAMRWVFKGGISATADPDRGIGLRLVLDHTRNGITLLFESGAVAVIGAKGVARLVGKSTQRVEGVIATISAPLQADVPDRTGIVD